MTSTKPRVPIPVGVVARVRQLCAMSAESYRTVQPRGVREHVRWTHYQLANAPRRWMTMRVFELRLLELGRMAKELHATVMAGPKG